MKKGLDKLGAIAHNMCAVRRCVMKATIVDLRRRMADVLRALDRNEAVKVFYRGRERAILVPVGIVKHEAGSVMEHSAFGMWKDHDELEDVSAYVRRLRKRRFHAS
jgi:antitoxin (DNA-binding transcriptional repressor) of toxin-antitoxin stability system